ncbi:MAG TPA: divalent-cation tolerance protein CutA [Pyrinomonadaceae bacterium]|nr:divalent-cation tolerance protein CutA [Pyrinomonadaceae bacterium]
MSDAIVVFMTTPNREEAARLAEMLVGARLAACVQILPEIESVYRWQGRIEREAEVLLLAKSTRDKFEELERQVTAIHSYETPEIMAVPVVAVSDKYRQWLNETVAP